MTIARVSRPIPEHLDHTKFMRLAIAVEEILDVLGMSGNPGVLDTPHRVAKMWLEEFSAGIGASASEALCTTFDESGLDEMIAVEGIPFRSMCMHHLLPYHGVCHIGYIPEGGVIAGLSKFSRLVTLLSSKPSIQERLTNEIADGLEEVLHPKGSMVVIRATHTCMTLRGAAAQGSRTTTSAVRGVFLDPSRGARAEFLSLVDRT